MAGNFRPLTANEIDKWITRRNQHERASRRFRLEPFALLFYGAIVPVAGLFGGSEVTFVAILWTWSALTAVACLVATFAETDAERAFRYSRWLAKYEAEMDQEARRDERDGPVLRERYDADLARFDAERQPPP